MADPRAIFRHLLNSVDRAYMKVAMQMIQNEKLGKIAWEVEDQPKRVLDSIYGLLQR